MSNIEAAANLPPRKRAKTQEEKEQRRIERILRNRRAAHASREKKRRHVELLETHVVDMVHVMKVQQQRDESLLKINLELMQMLKLSSDSDSKLLAALEDKISQLPQVPNLKMDTDSLLESNKRSGKKQKLTPKPRPIVLKKQSASSDEDEDEDEEDDDEDDDDELMGEQITKQDDLYLSPPISNIDSTSPSNLSLDLKTKLSDDYYLSNPLFDDLDKSDDLFSTNLQIKHEDEEELLNSLSFTADFNQQLQQQIPIVQPQQEINVINPNGIKMMHHPAVMVSNRLIQLSLWFR